jgi:isoleucyl-tRNA synthetase
MFKPVPTQVDFVAQERRILDLWREIQAFDKLRRKNRGREKFSFIDGPI